MAFAPSTPWKLPCIITWDGSRNQNLPTDSAEEAQNSTGDFFSRSPVVVDGITPAEIKTNFIYFKVTADGPFRTVSVSESGDTRTFDFGVDGWCTGDCTPRPAEKVKLVRITSRNPKKELHFTLWECRLRATLLSHTLECYDGK